MQVEFKSFGELTNNELYALLRLRAEVFVVEQNCPYVDLDNHDQGAIHLLGWQEASLAATTRIFGPGGYFRDYASIGRIATSPEFRAAGFGRLAVSESIAKIQQLYGTKCPIKIGAQQYLLKFYESFEFVSTGNEYLEDGIPHVFMIRG